ncbi:phage tail assembly chaperone [Priestia megaterium]|uniref:phage tail assembly chaperone n=1 Tax=Priestia megaterium TaxID=1404 RepID=UPI0034575CAE
MATKKPNALEALLSANPEVHEDVYIKRLDTDFTISAIDQDTFESAQKEATFDDEVNQKELNNLLIARSCIEPNFEDATLLKHYGARDAGDCVNKALKFGEIATLAQKILELSGFDTSLDKAKK